MENKEVKITIAEFYAFNMKSQRAYIDKTEEQILADLEHICKTKRLLSLTSYTAIHTDTKNFDAEYGLIQNLDGLWSNHPDVPKPKS